MVSLPLVGAWIEIFIIAWFVVTPMSLPLVGAWIEMWHIL